MLETIREMLFSPARQDGTLALSLACTSDTGAHRAHNEDNYFFFGHVMEQEHQSSEATLVATARPGELVVAGLFDGMGGELAGEGASYVAAQRLGQLASSLAPQAEQLEEAFSQLQRSVCDLRAARRLSSTGTTATVLVAQGMRAAVGNLGDSPAFLLRDGTLTTLTCADTDAALLAELGIDRRPGLTQYLGMDESDAPMEPHVRTLGLLRGDRILLASDGLTDMVDEQTIGRQMQTCPTAGALVEALRDCALDAGGTDNITLIACDVVKTSRAATARRAR